MRKTYVIFLVAVAELWCTPARADMVWPALVLEERLLSIPAIFFGLLVEWVIYYLFFPLTWKKSGIITVTINLVSTLIGIIFIPVAGLLWAIIPFNTFSPFSWAITYLLAVGLTSWIEIRAAENTFSLVSSRRDELVIVCANAASVGLAFLSLFIFPIVA